MKKKSVTLVLVLVLCMLFLQGCSMEGETSIKVVPNEQETRIEATLKADESKNYKWMYFTKEDHVTESATEFSNDIFSSTYTQKYGFVIDERSSDVLYFVLFKTDDIESGRIFEYSLSYNDEGVIQLGDKIESSLIDNSDLLEKVKEAQ